MGRRGIVNSFFFCFGLLFPFGGGVKMLLLACLLACMLFQGHVVDQIVEKENQ